MSTAILEQPQTERSRYAKDRERYSFVQMQNLLAGEFEDRMSKTNAALKGKQRAIELEIAYHGEAELAELAAMALVQTNRILAALNKPELIAWPKGWFDIPQGGCDSCGKLGYCRTASVGVTFPEDYSACHRCRDEEIDEDEYRLNTPLEVATGLRVEDFDDFWVLHTSNDQAIEVSRAHYCFDVLDLNNREVLTTREAVLRQDSARLAVVLPEDLSLFCSHFVRALYPTLVEGCE